MEDNMIIELYWARDEAAISETDAKYGHYCYTVAYNILADGSDAEESVSDTYFAAWRSMPPHRPGVLKSFLGKLTRRCSISLWRKNHAGKRGGGQIEAALEELSECIPDRHGIDERLELRELAGAIDTFLRTLPEDSRRVFIRRYWHLDSIDAISGRFVYRRGKVKTVLFRTREALRDYLSKEDLIDGR